MKTSLKPMLLSAAVFVPLIAPAVAEDITLDITFSPPRYTALYEELGERFEALNPGIQVEMSAPAENYDPLMTATLRAAIVGDLPDVSHQGMNHVRTYADRGLAVHLDDFIAGEGDWEALGYQPAITALGQVNGETYAVPFAPTLPVVFYNADLVEQAGGFSDEPPTTWPEIIALGERIDALGDDIMGLYFRVDSTSAWNFQTLLMSQGGQMMNEDETEIAFDGPAGQWALELLAEFGEAGQVDMSSRQARQAFQAGTLGILVISASGLNGLEAAAADSGFRLVVGPHPIPAEDGTLPVLGNNMIMFATDPERQAAAWEYMKFASGPIGQTIMANHSGYIPVNSIAIEGADYLADFYADHPNSRVAADLLPRGAPTFIFPDEDAARIFDMMNEVQLEVVTGRLSPQDGMAQMVSETEAMLAN